MAPNYGRADWERRSIRRGCALGLANSERASEAVGRLATLPRQSRPLAVTSLQDLGHKAVKKDDVAHLVEGQVSIRGTGPDRVFRCPRPRVRLPQWMLKS